MHKFYKCTVLVSLVQMRLLHTWTYDHHCMYTIRVLVQKDLLFQLQVHLPCSLHPSRCTYAYGLVHFHKLYHLRLDNYQDDQSASNEPVHPLQSQLHASLHLMRALNLRHCYMCMKLYSHGLVRYSR